VEVAVTRNLFAAILDRIARLTMALPVVFGRMPAGEFRGGRKWLVLGGKSARPRAPRAGKAACRTMIPATRTKKPGRPGEKWRKIHRALDAGEGRRVVTIAAIASLDRLQAQSLWEMSEKSMMMKRCKPTGLIALILMTCMVTGCRKSESAKPSAQQVSGTWTRVHEVFMRDGKPPIEAKVEGAADAVPEDQFLNANGSLEKLELTSDGRANVSYTKKGQWFVTTDGQLLPDPFATLGAKPADTVPADTEQSDLADHGRWTIDGRQLVLSSDTGSAKRQVFEVTSISETALTLKWAQVNNLDSGQTQKNILWEVIFQKTR
jgi:hypothetical protein